MEFLKNFGSIAIDIALIAACITFVISLAIMIVKKVKENKQVSNDSHDVTKSFNSTDIEENK